MIDRSIHSQQLTLDPSRRIIAVSDIHANLNIFQKLLRKIQFHPEQDELFLVGDLLEKGTQNLETLYYLMELAKNPHVHLLIGNCDFVCKNILYEYRLEFLKEILLNRKHSVLHEMAAAIHYKIDATTDMQNLAVRLKQSFLKELEFIATLPHVIETASYIFAHAAILNESTYGEDMRDIMMHDRFLLDDVQFQKYVIVGHIPVSEYCDTICDFNPKISEAKHIISIDGGNGVKHAGQLNALLIENDKFSFAHSDALRKAEILDDYQPEKQLSSFITWHERNIQLLEEQETAWLCKQENSDKTLWIPKSFIHKEEHGYAAENYTDYHMPVRKGDYVKIVSHHGNQTLIKKHGRMGWIPTYILKQP